MRFPGRTVKSLSDLVKHLGRAHRSNGLCWFRGHAVAGWSLVPSLGRVPGHVDAELAMIKRFQQNARPHLLSLPQTDWEWIFLMQHHRAPTRLLDWSESPLVALYFAVSISGDSNHENEDGAIWCLDPMALNTNSGHRRVHDKDVLAFDLDVELNQYLPDQVNAKKTDLQPVAAIGSRNSPRMVAQAGAFTIMHAKPYPIEDVGDKKHIWMFRIPAAAKAGLRRELALIGVTEFSLFPDLDRVATIAKDLLS